MSDQGSRGGQRPGSTKRPATRPAKRPAEQQGRGGGGILEGITGGDQQTTIGLVLIGFAIVLGLIFLVKGFSDDDGLVAVDEPATTTTTVAEIDRDASPVVDPSTTVPLTVREPAEVPVLVANGSGVQGAAGRMAEQLRGEGYDVVNTANATDSPGVAETEIHYAEGFEAEAERLAELLELDASVLVELADPGPVADTEGAEVVVVIGADIAAGTDSSATTADATGGGSTSGGATSGGATSGGSGTGASASGASSSGASGSGASGSGGSASGASASGASSSGASGAGGAAG